jgi:hypothetical protein
MAVRHGRPSVASSEDRTLPKPPNPCPHDLISRDGEIVHRFKPGTKPESKDVTGAIEQELQKK